MTQTHAEPFVHLVEVLDDSHGVVAIATTRDRTWVWVDGLEPDTDYRCRVIVDGEEWAAGERWDWVPAERGGYDLAPAGRSYDLRFRTNPAGRRRHRCRGSRHSATTASAPSPTPSRAAGSDAWPKRWSGWWTSTTFASSSPSAYRYVIARVPVYPAIGNHDTADTEGSDDRAQMEDNFHIHERFRDEQDRA